MELKFCYFTVHLAVAGDVYFVTSLFSKGVKNTFNVLKLQVSDFQNKTKA